LFGLKCFDILEPANNPSTRFDEKRTFTGPAPAFQRAGEMSQRAASAFWFMCRISIAVSFVVNFGFANVSKGGP
jgi:hypothetical protein